MSPRTRNMLLGVALAVLALLVSVMPASGRRPAKAPAVGMLWGARIGNQFTGSEAPWDWRAVTDFDTRDAGGAHLRVLHWSSPWLNRSTGTTYPFPAPTFERVRRHHVISFFDWANRGISDADVAAGLWDGYIRTWAAAAKSWGHPFFLRFDWEMNGPWFSWGVGDGNSAADFVAAWRHVHDIFSAVGANNVRWVWCPNVDPHRRYADLADLYPGNAYVDWTCLDGYNGDDPWTSFSKLFSGSYKRILQIAPSKSMIIGEVGSTEAGGSKARWIRNMFRALRTRFPAVQGVLWFDKYAKGPGGHDDWPIETSQRSSVAFARGVQSEETTRATRKVGR